MKNVNLMTVKMICLVGKETCSKIRCWYCFDSENALVKPRVVSINHVCVLVGGGCSVAEFIRLLVELYKQSYKFCYTAPFVSPGCIRVCKAASGGVSEFV